ncbi:hypothetical protein DdX_14078 [Ditylenchus destructor]|uniref:Uncharacterized protein n=1 Tax=Ditylenchus destructor TaxID=166010 RepID=A0AAD4MVB2_9BILA|nr:hypothetical protein DdX_14078 [Ditylenchus destructor]
MVILKPQQTSKETDMCTCRVEIEGEQPFPFTYRKKMVRSKTQKLGNTTWWIEVIWPEVALYCARENASDSVTGKFRVRLLDGNKVDLGPDAVLFQGKSIFSGPDLETPSIVTLRHDIGALFDDFGEMTLGVDIKIVQLQGTPEVEEKVPVAEENPRATEEEKVQESQINGHGKTFGTLEEKIPAAEENPRTIEEEKIQESQVNGRRVTFRNLEDKIPVAEENPRPTQEEKIQESQVNGHGKTFGNLEEKIPVAEENPRPTQEEKIQESQVNGHGKTFGTLEEKIPAAEENLRTTEEEKIQESQVNGHGKTFGTVEVKIPTAEENPRATQEEKVQESQVNGRRVIFGTVEVKIPTAEENPRATQEEKIQESQVNGHRVTFGDLNKEETNASPEETQPPMNENWKTTMSDQRSHLLDLEIRLKERMLYKIELEIREMEQRMGIPHRYIENS